MVLRKQCERVSLAQSVSRPLSDREFVAKTQTKGQLTPTQKSHNIGTNL